MKVDLTCKGCIFTKLLWCMLLILLGFLMYMGFPGRLVVKNLPVKAGDARDMGSVPGLGRSPGVGSNNLFQYSCLENYMGRGAWWATVHGAANSRTWLSTAHTCMRVRAHTHTHTHAVQTTASQSKFSTFFGVVSLYQTFLWTQSWKNSVEWENMLLKNMHPLEPDGEEVNESIHQ